MEATQESTQPCTDPRRENRNNSGLLEEDLSDVICILHPNSPAAIAAVAATAVAAPWHILQKDQVEYGIRGAASLDLALRLSSKVNDPKLGFCFGRTIGRCDILLSADATSRRISNTHFRVYFTDDGILMLEDVSTNGTIVDNNRLRKREQNSRMLTNGSVIQVINSDNPPSEVKFVVRMPNRDAFSRQYTENLEKHLTQLQARRPGAVQSGKRQPSVPNFLSMNTHGMHWSGGSKYNVTGQVGKGAFATVYKLATKQHGTVFAAKELDKNRFVKNGVLDQKVTNELDIMKDLKHPNIVEYIEHHEHDRWIYIIMEYVPLGELSTYLRHYVRIDEVMVQTITRQILQALKYLHKRRITHRDIKPDNILISSQEPLKVKLSDFGLSKVVQEETFLKTFCGTLLYCAPEVYPEYESYRRGEIRKRRRLGDPPPKTSPYDQSVDMWSLGAVLYHLLAGIPPFNANPDNRGSHMLQIIMTTEPDYDILRSEGVSEAGIDFVSKLLNRNPHQRPKERECFNHPWLVNVDDIDDYEDDIASDHSDGLSAIGEAAEDELDASQISLEDEPDVEGEVAESNSDLGQSKRPRIDGPPAEVYYPALPNIEISHDPQQVSESTPRRLFGEITSSALRSSHALGDDNMDPFEDGNYSIHDFVSSTGESMMSYGDSLNSVLSLPENPIAGSALSLLGAENLVGQLNMNSWHPGNSNKPLLSAEAASPQPNEGAGAVDDGTEEESRQPSLHATPKAPKFSRRIELPLPDTASERSSSDDSNARHVGPNEDSTTVPGQIFDIELANTMDAKTGQVISDDAKTESEPPADPSQAGGPVVIPRPLPTPPLLGKLTTLPGSIFDLTLPLEKRCTSWGRGPNATIVYPHPMDTRIPAYALELTFWAPSIEIHIEAGQDWLQVPGTMVQLSTKTRNCIWVNDCELRKAPEGGSVFGKLYTGDIITVYKHRNKFLKFECEFYHGDSARPRPEHEKGFKVRRVLTAKDGVVNQQPARQRLGVPGK